MMFRDVSPAMKHACFTSYETCFLVKTFIINNLHQFPFLFLYYCHYQPPKVPVCTFRFVLSGEYKLVACELCMYSFCRVQNYIFCVLRLMIDSNNGCSIFLSSGSVSLINISSSSGASVSISLTHSDRSFMLSATSLTSR